MNLKKKNEQKRHTFGGQTYFTTATENITTLFCMTFFPTHFPQFTQMWVGIGAKNGDGEETQISF